LTTVYFLGHTGDSLIMAGFGMGHVIMGACCMAFCFGLNGTLESKVSQAYGDKSYGECGLWLNRGRLISTLIMVPVSILFNSSGFMLRAIGQDERLAGYAHEFVTWMIPGAWAMV
jgi:multidrug resistance protein, MATE family